MAVSRIALLAYGLLNEMVDSIYFASVLRTHQGFVAPTDGPLLNYVQRVPLGVVAQITASLNI